MCARNVAIDFDGEELGANQRCSREPPLLKESDE
jgi:hypothetical protein